MSDLKSFDRVAHLYDETRSMPPEAVAAVGDGLAALMRTVAPAPHLLEVGIGTGRIAVPLAERGVRITGIDISRKMLQILRGKRSDIAVMLAEAAQPPLRPRSFDAALFVHILHLVPDAEATVRATLALVRPGGVLIEAGDDRDEDIRSRADVIIQQAVSDLSGVNIDRDHAYQDTRVTFAAVMAEAGADVRAEMLASWSSAISGRRLLERLRNRDYSSSWRIPDGIMPALLERVTPQISELFGGLDTPVESARTFSMRVAKLPS